MQLRRAVLEAHSRRTGRPVDADSHRDEYDASGHEEEQSRLKSEIATDESTDSAVTGNHGAFLYFEYAYELVDFPCLPIALP